MAHASGHAHLRQYGHAAGIAAALAAKVQSEIGNPYQLSLLCTPKSEIRLSKSGRAFCHEEYRKMLLTQI